MVVFAAQVDYHSILFLVVSDPKSYVFGQTRATQQQSTYFLSVDLFQLAFCHGLFCCRFFRYGLFVADFFDMDFFAADFFCYRLFVTDFFAADFFATDFDTVPVPSGT